MIAALGLTNPPFAPPPSGQPAAACRLRSIFHPLLLATALILGLLGPSQAAAQSDAAHQQFLFAYKLLQRGEDRLAAEAFDAYLGGFPQDAKRGDALYYRALLYHRAGDSAQAAALLADPPAPTLVPAYALDLLRGQILNDLKQYDAALASLERIDPSKLEPAVAASVHYLRGLAYRGAGNLPASAQQLTAAAALDSPLRHRATLDLARVQAMLDQPAQAIDTLQPCIDAGDAAIAAEAARLAGDLSYQRSRYDDAAAFYQQVVTAHQTSPHFGPSLVGLLWSHYAAGRFQTLLDAFAQYQPVLPKEHQPAAYYLAGSAQQELGQHEQAVALLEQAARDDQPLLEQALYKLAVSQFALGRFDAMRQTLDRFQQRFAQSDHAVDAAYLLAAAEAQAGDVARGAARLTQLIDQGPDHPYYRSALLRRAQLYEAHSQPAAAVADYQRYLQAAQEASDHSTTAQQAALRLIDLLHRLERFDESAATAQALLAQPNLDPLTEQEALYRLALAQMRQNQPDQALATLTTLHERFPLHSYRDQALYYRGLLLMSLGQPDEALPLLTQAAQQEKLEKDWRVNSLRLIAMHQRQAGGKASAAGTLAQLEALAGRDALNPDERLWLAQHLLDQNQAQTALTYLAPLQEPQPGVPAEARAQALYLAGKALRSQGKPQEAQHALRHVIAMGRGFDLEARLELARSLTDQGQVDAALAELAGLISAEPADIAAEAIFESAQLYRQKAVEAQRLQDTQGLAQAREQAQHLLKRLVLLYPLPELAPLPQRAYLELADLAMESGQADEAASAWQELADKFPDGPYAAYARAMLAMARQRPAEAAALLAPLRDAPLDGRLKQRVEAALAKLAQAG